MDDANLKLWWRCVLASGLMACVMSSSDAFADSLAESILESAHARGGLCIHIGCGDGALTASLANRERYIVHGLALDAAHVKTARTRIESPMLYGVASVDHCSLAKLPYADNLANLIVVDDLRRVLNAGCSMREIMRVLAPLGVAVIGTRADSDLQFSRDELQAALKNGGIDSFEMVEIPGVWAKFTKPRPDGMDEWTHAKHGPDRNPVARDKLVEPPNNLRWIYGPLWRGTSGIQLSANGRNIYSDGIVRDAFNGLRVCSLRSPGKYKYVTPQLAVGDRIYISAPRASQFLQAADVTTGKVVLTFDRIKNPKGLAHVDGELIFTSSDGTGCVAAATGKLKWMNEKVKVDGQPPHGASTLVVAEQRVLVQVPRDRRSNAAGRLSCLSLKSGRQLWQKSGPELQGDLLFYTQGVAVCCDPYRTYPKRIYAYAVEDGRFLWKSPPMNEGKSVGIYAIGGLIWCQHNRQMTGLDIATGKVKQTYADTPGTFKCAMPAATTRFVSSGSFAFFDLNKGTTRACRLDRNGCGSDPGVLFCNGLTYSFPKQCSCFSMMRGYTAYAADEPFELTKEDGNDSLRLVKGPAYAEEPTTQVGSTVQEATSNWPAFRHDAQRSASTSASLSLPLEKVWEANLENQTTPLWLHDDWRNHPSLAGPVSSAVAADGVLCAALSNSHRVVALDLNTGRLRWSFTAGGRVLVPPTIDGGRCYFGGQDGWAYCVNLDDGRLVWKFRAAPTDRRILAYGQLESLWPVSGGVLVEGGRAYFTAGRMSNLAGGMIGNAVDARTGQMLWKQSPPSGYEFSKENKIAPAYRNDVSVSGPGVIQLGHPRWIVDTTTGDFAEEIVPVLHRFVKPKPVPILGSTRDGLLDVSRSQLQGPTDMGHGYLAQEFGDVRVQQLVIGKDRIFGFQLPTIRTRYYGNKPTQTRNGLRRVAWDRSYDELWSKPLPEGTEIVALICAGEILYATGTRQLEERPYRKGMLWAYSAADGSKLASLELDELPAGEGLCAAYGKLYVTTQNGRLICLK